MNEKKTTYLVHLSSEYLHPEMERIEVNDNAAAVSVACSKLKSSPYSVAEVWKLEPMVLVGKFLR